MNVWMQLHDLSHSDLPDGSIKFAMRALSEFDWDSEILKEEQAAASGAETCPPGIGFVSEDGRILHVLPASHRRSHYHYHFPIEKKMLGFIPSTHQETISVQDLPDEHRTAIIQDHYDGRHMALLGLLRSHGTEWT
jgi:hypothetical protein